MAVTLLSNVEAVTTGNVPYLFSRSFNGRNLIITCTLLLDEDARGDDVVEVTFILLLLLLLPPAADEELLLENDVDKEFANGGDILYLL